MKLTKKTQPLSASNSNQLKQLKKRWRDKDFAIIGGFYISNECSIIPITKHRNIDINHNIFATEKQAKSAIAMARISQIIANDERFGGAIADEEWVNYDIIKWVIERRENNIVTTLRHFAHAFLAFHTKDQRDLFLEENEDLVKDYLMIN